MLLAAITAVLASVASAQFCAPSTASCQIQSDPFVNTFQSTTIEVHTTGTMYALQSKDMNVQVNMATKQRNGESVIIVDSITFACGNETPQTFTIETVGKAPRVLSCKAGSCAGTTCTATILEGSDPVPNVQVQEIRYFGTTGSGGICYDKDSKCPSSGTPPAGNQPSNGCSGGYCPPAPIKTPVYNPPVITPPAEIRPVKTPTYEVPMVTPPAANIPPKCYFTPTPVAFKTPAPADSKPTPTPNYVAAAKVVNGPNDVLLAGGASSVSFGAVAAVVAAAFML
ncbi:hypothetical protein BJ741DRAFT_603117 [Chytriomyces cf. hyalinus JEL632]|nr:hypothetical protein BJ741DRAFT_603117 [Chytriomyces cf. hyalinus JEL632]